MEPKYVRRENGAEVRVADLESMSGNAAHADDRTLAWLLQPRPFSGGLADRGIISRGSIVTPSGSADGRVRITPFKAVIGPRSAANTDPQDDLRDQRSSNWTEVSTNSALLQLDPTSSNHRWDLIWARVDVDVDEPAVQRFIKDAAGNVGSVPVVVSQRTRVTVGVTKGIEGASPVRASTPADVGASYYIPLAYVLLDHPFNASTTIAAAKIHEVAPILPRHPALGQSILRPADGMHSPSGIVVVTHGWGPGVARPEPFLPPTMFGGEQRYLQLLLSSVGATIPAGGDQPVDLSVDWRGRSFFWALQVIATGGPVTTRFGSAKQGAAMPLPTGGAHGLGVNTLVGFGNSYEEEDPNAVLPPGAMSVAALAQAQLTALAASSTIDFYVGSGGDLRCKVGAIAPQVRLTMWLWASAQNQAV